MSRCSQDEWGAVDATLSPATPCCASKSGRSVSKIALANNTNPSFDPILDEVGFVYAKSMDTRESTAFGWAGA